MTSAAPVARAVAHGGPGLRVGVGPLQAFVLFLLFASGCVVFIEPAPFELMFALVALVFVATGFRVSLLLLPLILTLILYNLGGGFSLMEVADETRPIMFIVISLYMAVVAITLAAIYSDDVPRRMRALRAGSVVAGVIATAAGIAGYFNIAGTADLFTLYGRAMGPFKDPNVFGTFLVIPAVMLAKDLIAGTSRRFLLDTAAFVFILAGVFLSFSRGAWAVVAGAIVLAAILLFLTSASARLRARIVLLGLAGIVGLGLLLAIALQFEQIATVFEMRASLNQSYDMGETGRFGNQRRSIPLLLDRPNGMGPMQFRTFFPEDPHNVYLNAFASYGWLGGFAYAALILSTLVAGWRLVFLRAPWQSDAIAIWSALFLLIIQGFQIDTDHWRHFYVLLGVTWGLTVASIRHSGVRSV
jgi:hypothetical protein